MDGLLGFAVAGFALAGSPGPNTLSLAATGAAFGARRGVGYMAGVNIGMVAVMAITASGVVSLFLAAPGATPIVTTVAAGYFAFLAYRIATAPPLTENTEFGRQPSFAGGVFLWLVNPKAYAAMAALFSGFVLVPNRFAFDATAKTIVLAAIITAVNLAWLIAGAALTRFFRDPRTSRAMRISPPRGSSFSKS